MRLFDCCPLTSSDKLFRKIGSCLKLPLLVSTNILSHAATSSVLPVMLVASAEEKSAVVNCPAFKLFCVRKEKRKYVYLQR